MEDFFFNKIDKKNQALLLCVLVSLVFHGSLVIYKTKKSHQLMKSQELGPFIIKLKPAKKSKQIVQTEERGLKEKPIKRAFLGKKDNRVERETMAKHIDLFNKAAKGNANFDAKKSAQTQSQKKSLKNVKLSDLGIGSPKTLSPQKFLKKQSVAAKKGLKTGDRNSRGLSSSNDFVKDVTLSDFTQLNTVEFKYYGFYHRIRQKLEQFWGRSIQEKAEAIYKSGRRLPASDNYTTSLQVTLNAKGEIVAVNIKSPSGVKELDDAAIESFNQAGPFPNPPKDLVRNGRAVIEWGFVVKS